MSPTSYLAAPPRGNRVDGGLLRNGPRRVKRRMCADSSPWIAAGAGRRSSVRVVGQLDRAGREAELEPVHEAFGIAAHLQRQLLPRAHLDLLHQEVVQLGMGESAVPDGAEMGD